MEREKKMSDLVDFFKVLGEPNRLRIVGLLAQRAYTVEQLGAALGVGVSTVSHHLTRLAGAGLVSARSESYYNLYSLKTDALSATYCRLSVTACAIRKSESMRSCRSTTTTPLACAAGWWTSATWPARAAAESTGGWTRSRLAPVSKVTPRTQPGSSHVSTQCVSAIRARTDA